jgi:hypothetical protein
MARTPEATATYDDVNLILRLYDLRREERLRQARAWFFANCHASTPEELFAVAPQGSEENASFRMVVSYWDMVASFIKAGVLNKELFFESGRELMFTWERIKPVASAIRGMFQDPQAWHNLESVAADYAEWLKKRSPGAYEAFVSNVVKRR